MKYSLVIDVQSYDEIGREIVHHHCVAMLGNDLWNLIRICERLYALISLVYENRRENDNETQHI